MATTGTVSSLGMASVSGLSSGIDWQSLLTQLRAVEQKKIDLVSTQKTTYTDQLSAWQGINTKLLALKTSAETLNETSEFSSFTTSLSSSTTTDATDILSATTTADASPGTYKVIVNSLASAQKLSSTGYASQTASLNLSGDILVGGKTVKISTTDSLSSIRDKFNAANSGTSASKVTASIVNYGKEGYRLILTSDKEGSSGMSLLNGGTSDLVGALGFFDGAAKTAKNVITGGNKSDAFSAADKAVGGSDLLNLSGPQSGDVTININGVARSVTLDLNSSLNSIRDAINGAFSDGGFTSDPASVVSENVNGTMQYRLLIEGNTLSYGDTNNILETLGVLKRAGVSDEKGVTGDVANTSAGAAITSSTLIKNIDGYNNYASGDTIALSGTDTTGAAVNSSFSITDTTTVGDLLNAIKGAYGDVTASLTADGKIRVLDNKIGDDQLSVALTPSSANLKFASAGDGSFGALSTIRSRQIQTGADASLSIDGVTVTSSTNTPDNIITGVKLNLKKMDPSTTVTLTVGRDYDAIKKKVQDFVTVYNDTMDAINAQMSYDSDKKTTGGPLFGDSTLRTLKSNLTGIILNKVTGVSSSFSTLGMVGINIGTDSKLTVDGTKLQTYLESNFDDIKKLFSADWSSTSGDLSYIYHTSDTKAGTYNIQITGSNPVTGYFATSGDATGSGEYLTGTSGDAKGLSVRYSGAATGAVGSFSLSYGIAELIQRSLNNITDTVNGTITQKEKTIQETIDHLSNNIDTQTAQLDQRMAEMERKFVAMETALSSLQSQSSWLSSEINKL